MKIGIITQPLCSNYGGLLQNYALQQTLINAGYEVETIDWGSRKTLRYSLYRIKIWLLHILFPNKYSKPQYVPNDEDLRFIRRNTNYFINSYIKHSPVLHSYDDFVRIANIKGYGAYIVGSDQCWRPRYNAFLSSMFLDFVCENKVKRIAYAASFGTDIWEFSEQQTIVCASLAKKFDLITVREDSGVKLCKEHLGVNAIHVLDPTMLLTKDDYVDLVKKEKEPSTNGTLFNYILDPDFRKTTFIKKVADAEGLKTFQVLPKYQTENYTKDNVKHCIEECVFPSVTAWLNAFIDAKMIIVDSFHGMVFSIIFNKPFWAIGNARRGMSRFTSLLKMFHLEDRLLDVDRLDDVDVTKPIDWEIVNNILEKTRKESVALLLNKLKE